MTAAVRNELDGLRLRAFVAELEAQVGSVDETEVARYGAMLAAASAATKADSPRLLESATMSIGADKECAVVAFRI
jgi:hypothetical protein